MADPITIGLSILGAVFSIIGGISEANALQQQADQQRALGEEEAARSRRDTLRILGQNRANIGGSGLALEGSPLEVLADTAAEGELDALTLIFERGVGAVDLERRASSARTKGFVSAGTSLLGAVAPAGRLGGGSDA